MATSDFQRYLDEALPKCVLAPEEADCVKQETAKPKRLIDANALKEKAIPDYESGEMLLYGSMVDEAPTVDAIVPPVKIGQVLWCNVPHSEFPLECRVYCLCREERNGLVLDYFRCTVKGWFAKAFSFEDVGKTIFQTREEAEAASEERKDNERKAD